MLNNTSLPHSSLHFISRHKLSYDADWQYDQEGKKITGSRISRLLERSPRLNTKAPSAELTPNAAMALLSFLTQIKALLHPNRVDEGSQQCTMDIYDVCRRAVSFDENCSDESYIIQIRNTTAKHLKTITIDPNIAHQIISRGLSSVYQGQAYPTSNEDLLIEKKLILSQIPSTLHNHFVQSFCKLLLDDSVQLYVECSTLLRINVNDITISFSSDQGAVIEVYNLNNNRAYSIALVSLSSDSLHHTTDYICPLDDHKLIPSSHYSAPKPQITAFTDALVWIRQIKGSKDISVAGVASFSLEETVFDPHRAVRYLPYAWIYTWFCILAFHYEDSESLQLYGDMNAWAAHNEVLVIDICNCVARLGNTFPRRSPLFLHFLRTVLINYPNLYALRELFATFKLTDDMETTGVVAWKFSLTLLQQLHPGNFQFFQVEPSTSQNSRFIDEYSSSFALSEGLSQSSDLYPKSPSLSRQTTSTLEPFIQLNDIFPTVSIPLNPFAQALIASHLVIFIMNAVIDNINILTLMDGAVLKQWILLFKRQGALIISVLSKLQHSPLVANQDPCVIIDTLISSFSQPHSVEIAKLKRSYNYQTLQNDRDGPKGKNNSNISQPTQFKQIEMQKNIETTYTLEQSLDVSVAIQSYTSINLELAIGQEKEIAQNSVAGSQRLLDGWNSDKPPPVWDFYNTVKNSKSGLSDDDFSKLFNAQDCQLVTISQSEFSNQIHYDHSFWSFTWVHCTCNNHHNKLEHYKKSRGISSQRWIELLVDLLKTKMTMVNAPLPRSALKFIFESTKTATSKFQFWSSGSDSHWSKVREQFFSHAKRVAYDSDSLSYIESFRDKSPDHDGKKLYSQDQMYLDTCVTLKPAPIPSKATIRDILNHIMDGRISAAASEFRKKNFAALYNSILQCARSKDFMKCLFNQDHEWVELFNTLKSMHRDVASDDDIYYALSSIGQLLSSFYSHSQGRTLQISTLQQYFELWGNEKWNLKTKFDKKMWCIFNCAPCNEAVINSIISWWPGKRNLFESSTNDTSSIHTVAIVCYIIIPSIKHLTQSATISSLTFKSLNDELIKKTDAYIIPTSTGIPSLYLGQGDKDCISYNEFILSAVEQFTESQHHVLFEAVPITTLLPFITKPNIKESTIAIKICELYANRIKQCTFRQLRSGLMELWSSLDSFNDTTRVIYAASAFLRFQILYTDLASGYCLDNIDDTSLLRIDDDDKCIDTTNKIPKTTQPTNLFLDKTNEMYATLMKKILMNVALHDIHGSSKIETKMSQMIKNIYKNFLTWTKLIFQWHKTRKAEYTLAIFGHFTNFIILREQPPSQSTTQLFSYIPQDVIEDVTAFLTDLQPNIIDATTLAECTRPLYITLQILLRLEFDPSASWLAIIFRVAPPSESLLMDILHRFRQTQYPDHLVSIMDLLLSQIPVVDSTLLSSFSFYHTLHCAPSMFMMKRMMMLCHDKNVDYDFVPQHKVEHILIHLQHNPVLFLLTLYSILKAPVQYQLTDQCITNVLIALPAAMADANFKPSFSALLNSIGITDVDLESDILENDWIYFGRVLISLCHSLCSRYRAQLSPNKHSNLLIDIYKGFVGYDRCIELTVRNDFKRFFSFEFLQILSATFEPTSLQMFNKQADLHDESGEFIHTVSNSHIHSTTALEYYQELLPLVVGLYLKKIIKLPTFTNLHLFEQLFIAVGQHLGLFDPNDTIWFLQKYVDLVGSQFIARSKKWRHPIWDVWVNYCVMLLFSQEKFQNQLIDSSSPLMNNTAKCCVFTPTLLPNQQHGNPFLQTSITEVMLKLKSYMDQLPTNIQQHVVFCLKTLETPSTSISSVTATLSSVGFIPSSQVVADAIAVELCQFISKRYCGGESPSETSGKLNESNITALMMQYRKAGSEYITTTFTQRLLFALCLLYAFALNDPVEKKPAYLKLLGQLLSNLFRFFCDEDYEGDVYEEDEEDHDLNETHDNSQLIDLEPINVLIKHYYPKSHHLIIKRLSSAYDITVCLWESSSSLFLSLCEFTSLFLSCCQGPHYDDAFHVVGEINSKTNNSDDCETNTILNLPEDDEHVNNLQAKMITLFHSYYPSSYLFILTTLSNLYGLMMPLLESSLGSLIVLCEIVFIFLSFFQGPTYEEEGDDIDWDIDNNDNEPLHNDELVQETDQSTKVALLQLYYPSLYSLILTMLSYTHDLIIAQSTNIASDVPSYKDLPPSVLYSLFGHSAKQITPNLLNYILAPYQSNKNDSNIVQFDRLLHLSLFASVVGANGFLIDGLQDKLDQKDPIMSLLCLSLSMNISNPPSQIVASTCEQLLLSGWDHYSLQHLATMCWLTSSSDPEVSFHLLFSPLLNVPQDSINSAKLHSITCNAIQTIGMNQVDDSLSIGPHASAIHKLSSEIIAAFPPNVVQRRKTLGDFICDVYKANNIIQSPLTISWDNIKSQLVTLYTWNVDHIEVIITQYLTEREAFLKSVAVSGTKTDKVEDIQIDPIKLARATRPSPSRSCRLNEVLTLLVYVDAYNQSIRKRPLHYGQIIAVLTQIINALAVNDKENCGAIVQVNTGEGKTFIASLLAASLTLMGCVVDVVSSSPLLATRDAEESGPFFRALGLACSDNADPEDGYQTGQKDCYKFDSSERHPIVYGDLGGFQFDWLRHYYHHQRTMCAAPGLCPNCNVKNHDLDYKPSKCQFTRLQDIIIIDEADNVLIDQCNDVARLCEYVPGMDEIEPLLSIIWQYLQGKYLFEEVHYFDTVKKNFDSLWVSAIDLQNSPETPLLNQTAELSRALNQFKKLVADKKVVIPATVNETKKFTISEEKGEKEEKGDLSVSQRFKFAIFKTSSGAIQTPETIDSIMSCKYKGDIIALYVPLIYISIPFDSQIDNIKEYCATKIVPEVEKNSCKTSANQHDVDLPPGFAMSLSWNIIPNLPQDVEYDQVVPNKTQPGFIIHMEEAKSKKTIEIYIHDVYQVEFSTLPYQPIVQNYLNTCGAKLFINTVTSVDTKQDEESITKQFTKEMSHHFTYKVKVTPKITYHSSLDAIKPQLLKDVLKKFDDIMPSMTSAHIQLYVKSNLDVYIDNALQAASLEENIDYVIDDNTVRILDSGNTGVTLSSNVQWDGGLHQFLQLKHNLPTTTPSLAPVFISNLSYISKYQRRLGMTGTVGDQDAKDLYSNLYQIQNMFIIPPFNYERRVSYPVVICSGKLEHFVTIAKSAFAQTLLKRSVLIIFDDSATAAEFQGLLFSYLPQCEPNTIVYINSDHAVQADRLSNSIPAGTIIISTNLSGRGTNIATDQYEKHGGLHVIHASISPNSRIERQSVGRTARQGRLGTKQIIVCSPAQQDQARFPFNPSQEQDFQQITSRRDKHDAQTLAMISHIQARATLFKDGLFSQLLEKKDECMSSICKDPKVNRTVLIEKQESDEYDLGIWMTTVDREFKKINDELFHFWNSKKYDKLKERFQKFKLDYSRPQWSYGTDSTNIYRVINSKTIMLEYKTDETSVPTPNQNDPYGAFYLYGTKQTYDKSYIRALAALSLSQYKMAMEHTVQQTIYTQLELSKSENQSQTDADVSTNQTTSKQTQSDIFNQKYQAMSSFVGHIQSNMDLLSKSQKAVTFIGLEGRYKIKNFLCKNPKDSSSKTSIIHKRSNPDGTQSSPGYFTMYDFPIYKNDVIPDRFFKKWLKNTNLYEDRRTTKETLSLSPSLLSECFITPGKDKNVTYDILQRYSGAAGKIDLILKSSVTATNLAKIKTHIAPNSSCELTFSFVHPALYSKFEKICLTHTSNYKMHYQVPYTDYLAKESCGEVDYYYDEYEWTESSVTKNRITEMFFSSQSSPNGKKLPLSFTTQLSSLQLDQFCREFAPFSDASITRPIVQIVEARFSDITIPKCVSIDNIPLIPCEVELKLSLHAINKIINQIDDYQGQNEGASKPTFNVSVQYNQDRYLAYANLRETLEFNSTVGSMATHVNQYTSHYGLRGFTTFFTFKVLIPFPWFAVIMLAVLAVAQIVAGILCAVAGMPTLAASLISEGISDFVEMTRAIITRQFDIKAWARDKAISIAMSLLGAGLGGALSKTKTAVKVAQSGCNTTRSAINAAKQASKMTSRSIAKKATATAAGKQVLSVGIGQVIEHGILPQLIKKFDPLVDKFVTMLYENTLDNVQYQQHIFITTAAVAAGALSRQVDFSKILRSNIIGGTQGDTFDSVLKELLKTLADHYAGPALSLLIDCLYYISKLQNNLKRLVQDVSGVYQTRAERCVSDLPSEAQGMRTECIKSIFTSVQQVKKIDDDQLGQNIKKFNNNLSKQYKIVREDEIKQASLLTTEREQFKDAVSTDIKTTLTSILNGVANFGVNQGLEKLKQHLEHKYIMKNLEKTPQVIQHQGEDFRDDMQHTINRMIDEHRAGTRSDKLTFAGLAGEYHEVSHQRNKNLLKQAEAFPKSTLKSFLQEAHPSKNKKIQSHPLPADLDHDTAAFIHGIQHQGEPVPLSIVQNIFDIAIEKINKKGDPNEPPRYKLADSLSKNPELAGHAVLYEYDRATGQYKAHNPKRIGKNDCGTYALSKVLNLDLKSTRLLVGNFLSANHESAKQYHHAQKNLKQLPSLNVHKFIHLVGVKLAKGSVNFNRQKFRFQKVGLNAKELLNKKVKKVQKVKKEAPLKEDHAAFLKKRPTAGERKKRYERLRRGLAEREVGHDDVYRPLLKGKDHFDSLPLAKQHQLMEALENINNTPSNQLDTQLRQYNRLVTVTILDHALTSKGSYEDTSHLITDWFQTTRHVDITATGKKERGFTQHTLDSLKVDGDGTSKSPEHRSHAISHEALEHSSSIMTFAPVSNPKHWAKEQDRLDKSVKEMIDVQFGYHSGNPPPTPNLVNPTTPYDMACLKQKELRGELNKVAALIDPSKGGKPTLSVLMNQLETSVNKRHELDIQLSSSLQHLAHGHGSTNSAIGPKLDAYNNGHGELIHNQRGQLLTQIKHMADVKRGGASEIKPQALESFEIIAAQISDGAQSLKLQEAPAGAKLYKLSPVAGQDLSNSLNFLKKPGILVPQSITDLQTQGRLPLLPSSLDINTVVHNHALVLSSATPTHVMIGRDGKFRYCSLIPL